MGMEKFPQTMINVKLPRQIDVTEISEVRAAVDAAELRLVARGRVLLRPSGTEPVVRVMVEGEDAQLVAQIAAQLADVVEQAVA